MVVGVDINPAYTEIARARFMTLGSRLHLVNGDVMEVELPAVQFDLVHVALLLEYVDPLSLLRRIHRWLSPEGPVDYLLTWNCKHIANATLRSRMEAITRSAGFEPPLFARRWNWWRSRTMPLSDHIVDEIHAIREAIAKESDYDLQKIAEAARARQKASGRQSLKLPPRRTSSAKKAC